ncbi:hypothetical protein L1987_83718 [Smallanthus sonchifolius]|uniref:Uncharacterized protein n=1 Tax=Smallanthus sonchifolius TaxID=185202 RepID=A0ACB8YDM5_9ASTR|nr:hypothetical protein L1987_83718 [Smallanthus sonchifolius]
MVGNSSGWFFDWQRVTNGKARNNNVYGYDRRYEPELIRREQRPSIVQKYTDLEKGCWAASSISNRSREFACEEETIDSCPAAAPPPPAPPPAAPPPPAAYRLRLLLHHRHRVASACCSTTASSISPPPAAPPPPAAYLLRLLLHHHHPSSILSCCRKHEGIFTRHR